MKKRRKYTKRASTVAKEWERDTNIRLMLERGKTIKDISASTGYCKKHLYRLFGRIGIKDFWLTPLQQEYLKKFNETL